MIFQAAAQNVTYAYKNINSYSAFLQKTSEENALVLNKKIQKTYREFISEKNTELIKRLNEKGFLFDTIAYPYLNSIFNHILEKNSLDKNRFHFFIDRTSSVNAYSYEDGTVVCNLGLLGLMENESQLAMVFCHELGHVLLKHVNTGLVRQLEKYNSPEFLAQLKHIEKQRYNTKKQLENLLVNDVFDRRKHSRSQENAADSLGMVLFSNSSYGARTVSRIFNFLDSAENKTTSCSIHAFFEQEKISIDENWLKSEKKMSFGAAEKKEITDSLKTHPDCAKRKIAMESFFRKKPKPGIDFLVGNKQKLALVKKTALFDEAEYSKDIDNLGLYLYQLIQNNSVFPLNAYIKTATYNTMLSLGKHSKAHTLHEVVNSQYVSSYENDQYAVLLKLLDNISLENLNEITHTYYQNNKLLITNSKN
ncbi:M48 family metallopeptidase [Mucilaginibacter xinganensis]|uniref:M48 family metallopeptidase n=1 Tax=Mucilaginibacter xinganensis TaxID=1234841 RepID=UPI0012FDCB73|nr:M48 family metallopeptidase [Mucilaginibacter xinganensis]